MNLHLTVAACALLVAGFAHAQPASTSYPTRPVRLIVPYPAGGGTDIVMRAIQPVLNERLGQPVVIDNRPGATGAIGSELAARAAPDGYTLLAHTSGGLTIAPHTFAKPRFDPVKDFVPITQATSSPFVLVVHPKVPATSLQQFIALAKSRPGELNYATSGTGSSPHLATLLLSKLAGINMVHIPYKGSGPATTDLLAGQVQVRFSSVPPAMPHIKSGRLRGLATTGSKRFSLLPELPTIGETVPGYVVDAWYAVLAPAGTPAAIVRKLNAELVKALQTPETQTRLRADGVEPVGSTPQHLGELLRNDLARWAPLVKESGAQAN
jgi:tripartite-type tricarboxylate transporter receptor subunit TctC